MEETLFGVLKKALVRFFEDQCSTLAASLAFYTVFALPSMLYLLLTFLTISLSVGSDMSNAELRARSFVQRQATELIGNKAAASQIDAILEASRKEQGSVWKTIFSLIGIVVGATGLVIALQDSLNRVWRVEPDERLGGVRIFIFKRLLSLGLILGLGFFLLASLIINTLLSMSIEFVGNKLGISEWLGIVANYALSTVIITIIFGSIFKFMPDAKIRWRDVGIGALGTSVMFLLGRMGLHWYLSFADPSQQLGSAAASLAAILIWIYYTSSILLLGAEFTQAWSHRHGERTVPELGAIPTDVYTGTGRL